MYAEFAAFSDRLTTSFLDGAIAGGLAFSLTYMRGALMVLVLTGGVLVWTNRLDLWWLVRRVLIALIVVTLVRAGDYNRYVRIPFWETIPNALATSVAGGAVRTTTAERFDRVSAAAANLVAQADSKTPMLNVRVGVALSIIQGAMKIAVFLCFSLWIISRVAVALLLAAGPYLMIAALFDATRYIVLGWFGKLVSLTVWTLFVMLLTELLLQGMMQWVQRANAMGGAAGLNELLDNLWNVAAWFCVCAVVLLGLPYYASIGGGAAGGPHVGLGAGFAAARMGAGAMRHAATAGGGGGAAGLGAQIGRAAARAFNRMRPRP